MAEAQLRDKDKEIAELKQQNANNLRQFSQVVKVNTAALEIAKSSLITALKALDDARIVINIPAPADANQQKKDDQK
jgi:hypothetical protein